MVAPGALSASFLGNGRQLSSPLAPVASVKRLQISHRFIRDHADDDDDDDDNNNNNNNPDFDGWKQ
jgi:hypothetical protein